MEKYPIFDLKPLTSLSQYIHFIIIYINYVIL